MKKVLALCLTAVLMLTMSLVVFAAPNGFANSPSGTPGPEVVSFDPADEECDGRLVITPYSEKKDLPKELKDMIEKAYSDITSSNDLTKLNNQFAVLVANKNLNAENLAVSDLFDIHVADCTVHEGHVDFDIVLDADTLSHFVGLLHFNKGQWELVEDAKVISNGEHLAFSVESFSPFAIVVDTTTKGPQTGDGSMIYLYAAVMALSAAALVFVAIRARKQKA